ncbi:MAG: DUF5691 domain-containing protein [Nakamurella sp.]
MTAPSDLITAATVGTAHRSIDLAALPDPLRPDPIGDDVAAALLDAAALCAVARRTLLPTVPDPVGTPIRPVSERLEVVPDVVRQVLSRVSNQPAILLEALSLIRRAGLRLPPELVPGLLDDARPDVVSATQPVAGEIGRLLIGKNPRWVASPAPDPADRTDWDEGTTVQRVQWLRALRRVDPAGARNLLKASFSAENAGNRAELLSVLGDGLSSADEEFLQTAVADRSRAVVATAMELLGRLPGSALRRDMRTLAARHLTIGHRLLRTTVHITSPSGQEFDPWPLPDGDPWTVLLSRIDPAEWPQIFGGDLLKLIAADTDALQPLLPGFRRAAIAFGRSGLAQTLITGMFSRVGLKAPPVIDDALWAVLDPSDAAVLLDRLLTRPQTRPDQVTTAATALAVPWPGAVARRLARWLPAGGHGGAPAPRQLWDLLARATALSDCRELADLLRAEMAAATGDHRSMLTTRASNAANLLTLRALLYETLDGPGGK